MGRNKYIQCKICLRSLRSDNLKSHQKQHEQKSKYQMKIKNCSICKKFIARKNLARHLKVHKNTTNEILQNIESDQKIYDNIGKTGTILKELIKDNDIDPMSLRKDYQKALDVDVSKKEYQHHALKPWQEQLLNLMKPSQREIIWICGNKGAEGKSWFQNYLEQNYTYKRVFRTSIDKNKESVLHSISKKLISLLDVFIFNVPRSFNEDLIPYTLFEDIKDGFAISTKYDSKQLRFNTPNIVIVFSNVKPNKNMVSLDRWKILDIINDKLF